MDTRKSGNRKYSPQHIYKLSVFWTEVVTESLLSKSAEERIVVKPENLILIKGISPAVYVAKVRTLHTHFIKRSTHPSLINNIYSTFSFSPFSSIVDLSWTCALQSEPAEKYSRTWHEITQTKVHEPPAEFLLYMEVVQKSKKDLLDERERERERERMRERGKEKE